MNAPFSELLDYLRGQGFPIGVESHLRSRALLNQLGDTCAPADLKTLLCPLFATNAEQQELFYRAFDTYYPCLLEPQQEPSDRLESPLAAGAQIANTTGAIRRWPYLLAGALLLVLLVVVLTWSTKRLRAPAIPSAPAASSTAVSEQSPPSPQTGSRVLGGEKSVSVRRLPPSVSPSLASYSDYRIALGWAVLLGPLMFWLSYEVYRLRQNQFLIRKRQGKTPPYSWPIQAGQRNPSIYDAHELAGVSQLLHRRHEAESERLDIESTIVSSIASLGFPVFQYRKDTRLPEYLFLIDRCNFRDHQACLFDNLAGLLQEQGLFVSAWFYEGDPRVCWDKTGGESLDLEELQRRLPGSRLLIFGDGDEFLDPVTGRLSHWHRLLWGWRDRALLTPLPPSEWGMREYTLAAQFLVAPATLGGLNAVAVYFQMPQTADWDFPSQGQESPDSHDGPEIEASLRRRLGDGAFQWLCACAVYPELHWDLTLRLGSMPSMPTGLVQEENIIRLLQLRWFRTGSMPDDLRRKLIAHLGPALQQEVRESIIHLLENNPVPAGTFAADVFQFQIAYQRYWADPHDRKARRRLQDALANLSPDEVAQDYAYLEAAELASHSPLHILLPERLRKVLYSVVGPSIGVRSVARGLVCLAIAAGSLLALHSLDGKVAVAIARYKESLLRGRGLSLSESNGSVRIDWSPGSYAGQHAVRGRLIIQDGARSKSYAVELTKDQLEDGEREIKAEFSPVAVALTLYDEGGNTVEQTARIERRCQKCVELMASLGSPGGTMERHAQVDQSRSDSLQTPGRVFQPPPSGKATSPAPQLDQPGIDIRADANASAGVVDRLLTSTGVLPPPTSSGPFPEQPVGIVLVPGGSKLLRAGVETPLAAAPGDILFSGDVLRTEAAPASFLYCPTKSSQSLAPSGDVLFGPAQMKVRAGKLVDTKPIGPCFLPKVAPVSVASKQYYGVNMTKGLKDEQEPKPVLPEQWPPGAAAEIAVFDKALANDPNDQSALVGRAAAFENYKLLANALADYKKISDRWNNAVWVKGKVFELSEALASRAASSGAKTFPGKTYALLIGISKYEGLRQDAWLQYASSDAKIMDQALRTRRLGALRDENITLLTDEKATTAAIRGAFQSFLKGRATRNDTVIILIVGHGTVETPGSKGAFLLTYDSDPQDLKGTALPITEVQTLINDELSKLGRVAIFVDVCRAGNIGSIKNRTVNSAVEKLGEAEGQILGIMASRPRELSYEGPEFGGGHGVFTYFLVQGLMGAADQNKDGKVDVDELINYIAFEVKKATGDKQHPREFGTMDNRFVLSDAANASPSSQ